MRSLASLHAVLFLLLCVFAATPAMVMVHLPTGEFRETAEDLRVKVRGDSGHVMITRTWEADDLNKSLFRWHPHPAWDDLNLTLDMIDGVPKTIHRTK